MDYSALAGKYGGTAVAPSPSSTPGSPDLSAIAAKYGGSSTAAPQPAQQSSSGLADFAKSVFTAPATIVARPFQAAAELAGASDTQVNDFTKKIPVVGGLVAPVPEGVADVKKDVGRAVQTVALGTGAPIAGGALFGAGASLEQGNDLFSVQTAFNTALGAAGGKVLDFIGKPLLNAAGKVVGTITPKILKNVAAGGTDAITKFAADHQLLGGVAAKPAALLAKGLQGVDNAVGAGASKVAQTTGKVLSGQYPGFDIKQHFLDVNARDIAAPTTINKPAYSTATAIFNDAKRRGINLSELANTNGISHDSISEGGNFNTKDTADQLKKQNFDNAKNVLRPAVAAIQHEVPNVPITQVRGALLERVHNAPASQINAAEREALAKHVESRFGDSSAEARAHPNGYTLTDLLDSRIEAGSRGKYKAGVTPAPDIPKAKLARQEEGVFRTLFDRNVPANSGLDEVRKNFEANFLLSDYLNALHTKAVPASITKKAVRIFGRGVGGFLGSEVAGFPGFLVGSRGGDMLFHSFELLPSPIKQSVLQSAFENKAKSDTFNTLQKHLGDIETARLLRKALPPAGGSSFKETPPTIFTTPGGKSTPIKSEAIDLNAVESGKIKAPGTDRRLGSYLKKVENAKAADHQYSPEKTIPMGPKPPKPKSVKRLNDIKF